MITDELPSLMSYTPQSFTWTDTDSIGTYKAQLQEYATSNILGQLNPSYTAVINQPKKEKKMPEEKKATRRVVRIFIVDPDENMPLDTAVLYKGDEQLTDLNDDELFLEIGIKPLLDKHNGYRATVLDKKASSRSGKDIFLEPIRIRNLKMVVSCIAEF